MICFDEGWSAVKNQFAQFLRFYYLKLEIKWSQTTLGSPNEAFDLMERKWATWSHQSLMGQNYRPQ
jgi:hypothetical protein